jgi:hypothetical protein
MPATTQVEGVEQETESSTPSRTGEGTDRQRVPANCSINGRPAPYGSASNRCPTATHICVVGHDTESSVRCETPLPRPGGAGMTIRRQPRPRRE